MKVFGSDPNSSRATNKDSRTGNVGKKGGGESQGSNKVSSNTATGGGSERVVLTAPKEMQKVKSIIARTPDIRTKKVEELKQRIENGEYNVPGSKIAGKMLIEMLGSQAILRE